MLTREGHAAIGTIQRVLGRRYPQIEQMLAGADQATQMQFLAMAREFETKVNLERRSFRPFPGGPRIRT